MFYADLHIHTYYSDGLFSPNKVLYMAKENQVKVVAITDHDTLFHLDMCQDIADGYDIKLIRGVELSCYNSCAKKKVHIIGLGITGKTPKLNKITAQIREGRNACHRIIIDELKKAGYDIDYEYVLSFSHSQTISKIHIFKALQNKYPNIDESFYKQHFMKTKHTSADDSMSYIDVEQGIQAILHDGGIPILAHPNFYDSFPDVKTYVDFGLQGIEISHVTMNENDRTKARELAKAYGLKVSGGSDYHPFKSYPSEIGEYGISEKDCYELLSIIS
ncbi:PHP domain-containing protein [Fannyhessea vaginae]|uniref:PHP domain-containing protein n=1 Tax=Fannyhessea vaginae TaxID=82135 RepID=UPI0026F0613A|nr:PHP domain-containing protein [Fannyhessea vaginae]